MEKILKIVFILTSCVFFITCSSVDVWKTNAKITPNSYKSHSKYSKHTVGLLRRLLIIPVQFQTLKGDKPFFEHRTWIDHTDSELGYSSDEHAGDRFFETTVDYLSNWKGYEAINLSLSQIDINQAFLGTQDIKKYTQELYNWSANPENYENPTENIIKIITKLGKISNADGVLIISGVNKLPSDAKVAAVILSASLLWPILFFDTGISFQAHIFEVNTGKIVWKSSGAPSIQSLFKNLENAIPKAMTR